jgi:hypothetical protein
MERLRNTIQNACKKAGLITLLRCHMVCVVHITITIKKIIYSCHIGLTANNENMKAELSINITYHVWRT